MIYQPQLGPINQNVLKKKKKNEKKVSDSQYWPKILSWEFT